MVAVMMASSAGLSASAFAWALGLIVVAAAASGFIAWGVNTPKRRMALAVTVAIFIAILITGTKAWADDIACAACGCFWWWC